jgi:hypothetical protein
VVVDRAYYPNYQSPYRDKEVLGERSLHYRCRVNASWACGLVSGACTAVEGFTDLLNELGQPSGCVAPTGHTEVSP